MQRFAFALALAMSTAAGSTAGEADKTSPAPEDPYLWLEDVTGDKPLDWVRRGTPRARRSWRRPRRSALEKRILDDPRLRRSASPTSRSTGALYYNFWRDAKNPRGLWRRTTLEEYRKAEPAWETVLDVDALGEAEKENWVWHGAQLPRARLRALPGLALPRRRRRRRGPRVRPRARSFVKDGFYAARGQEHGRWSDRDTLFVGTDFGPGSLTDSGYPRIVKEWKRGTPLEPRPRLVFEGEARGRVAPRASSDRHQGLRARLRAARRSTFFTSELFLRRDGKLVKIDKPDDANANVHRDLLLVELRDDWTVGGQDLSRRARCWRPTSRTS